MEFRLIHEGPLHGQGAKSPHEWEIRRALHPQLQRLHVGREHPRKEAWASLPNWDALVKQRTVESEPLLCQAKQDGGTAIIGVHPKRTMLF
jgi:hypothetical protein